MKRTGPPARRTPLSPGAPLNPGGPLRRSPLARKAPLPRAPLPCPEQAVSKPSRPKVTAEERRARKLVRARSGGVCEGCGEAPATDWAHRVGKAQGGPWCPSNGLHLCSPCHRWCHAYPEAARERGWMLLRSQVPRREPAVLAGWGRVLLTVDGDVLPASTIARQ